MKRVLRRAQTRRQGPTRSATVAALLAIVSAACEPLQLPTERRAEAPKPPSPAVTQPTTVPGGDVLPLPRPDSGPIRRVALLLPLSGNQAALAEAVRDGFLAAHFAAPDPRPDIVIFDEERPVAANVYQDALTAGADMVVGPLLKESVAEAASSAGTTATLALNYLDASAIAPPFFFQFSLWPEDEARQAAEQAAAEGRLRALALVPDSEWGQRMLNAFRAALEQQRGTLLAFALYDPAATDYTGEIQRLLLIDESRARQRQLATNLGQSLEFGPRRRSDVDFIFLAANPGAGRLIRPQLQFLYAGDVPTYSTSAIYQAGMGSEGDLEGVMFMDAPVVVAPDSDAETLRMTLSRRWPPGALQRARFYAMGYDAWRLMAGLRQGQVPNLDGLSGRLYADAQGRIHRQLRWAQVLNGRIVPLPQTVTIAPPSGTLTPPSGTPTLR